MKDTYRPHEFGKLISKSVSTLQRWDREGILTAERSPTGRRYYTHEQYLEYTGRGRKENRKAVVYCRVSGHSQKQDMLSQKKALEEFCTGGGIAVSEWLSDIGSGLNYRRKNFVNLMQAVETGGISVIVIAHKDRLVRFGFEWFEHFCKQHGAEIIVMNRESLSPEAEMVQDMLSIIHCFSSRLYGLRKYKRNIKEIIHAADDQADKPAGK